MPKTPAKPGALALMTAASLFLASALLSAGQAPAKKITYEQAYENKEPRLLKAIPQVSWFDDEHYLVRERDEKTRASKLFKVSARTGERTLFLDFRDLEKDLPRGIDAEAAAAVSKDYETLIYENAEDLYLYRPKTRTFRRLTAASGRERNPRLSPDSKFLAYTRNNNLYACDLESGLEYEITADGSATVYNGWASWVYYEEILGRGSRYAAFWWSPDSRRLVFLRFDDGPVPVFHLVRSTGTHGELEIQRYPKSGDPNPRVRVGIVTLPENRLVWADFDENADHYVAWPFWHPSGKGLTVQWMNRGQDNVKIYDIDIESGKKREIYDEKQPAWVEFFEDLYFLRDGNGFLLRSDADGWRHLYHYGPDGQLKARLTSGEWDVQSISLVDEKNRLVYFQANREKTPELHLYRVGFDGRSLERLTGEPGTHRVQVSPAGSYFLDSYSSVSSPPRLDLRRADGTLIRCIDRAETPELAAYALGRKELFFIPTEDGLELPAYWILPPDFDPSKVYPVLFQVYGGPGSSTVSDTYPSLAQLYLAQEGIIVLSVDHRGSGHFGKKGTARMHRNLGKWEMHDLLEAARWLRTKPFVDGSRIGITGGSYGGYVTCLALTYGAEGFTHGIASSSVTDWKLYDSVYTERYMDSPAENPAGYEFGSVMSHAAKLKGVLLIEHGDMDDNVHLQNSLQLIDALMAEGKMFDFMIYPNERHGYGGKKRDHASRLAVQFWFRHLLGR